MGGTTFDHYQDGADVNEAFMNARAQAGYEHGHGGYSGTIVEKPGFVIIQREPVSLEEAEVLAYKLIDSDDDRIRDKWGNAGAIPVSKEAESNLSTKEITFTTGTFSQSYDERQLLFREKAAEKLKLPVDSIISVRVIEDTPGKPQVKAVATEGKAETRFVVSNSGHRSWQTGLPTQAAARAKAVELASVIPTYNHGYDSVTYEVDSITRRESGEPLVRVTRTITKHTIKAEVTYRKPGVPKSGDITGWLFFGWASC